MFFGGNYWSSSSSPSPEPYNHGNHAGIYKAWGTHEPEEYLLGKGYCHFHGRAAPALVLIPHEQAKSSLEGLPHLVENPWRAPRTPKIYAKRPSRCAHKWSDTAYLPILSPRA
eukprot:TRINITY_DN10526_c0_g1_i1.p1 TRINITY_DN10526_c0_g1~~TRINITY_DN10526_c0_g1_i1.p1  ORF type:complete len:113 (-),score=4.43 TRINITY_DN10526_c0_g1_i1:26-364(-)